MMKSNYLPIWIGTVFAVLVLVAVDAYSCTRVFWNTNADLMIVGRNEDYVTASHPTFVATPRGQFGNLIHDFVPIQGDIYDMQPD